MNCDYNLTHEELLDEIKQVQQHWAVLNSRLNWSDDKRTIEQISYEMLANEKRYDYLLKLAKEQNLRTSEIVLREGAEW